LTAAPIKKIKIINHYEGNFQHKDTHTPKNTNTEKKSEIKKKENQDTKP
jgi:hypothetical protein